MIKTKLQDPHETQEKNNKKKLHVMFSIGQYRSTEKVINNFCPVSENTIFF